MAPPIDLKLRLQIANKNCPQDYQKHIANRYRSMQFVPPWHRQNDANRGCDTCFHFVVWTTSRRLWKKGPAGITKCHNTKLHLKMICHVLNSYMTIRFNHRKKKQVYVWCMCVCVCVFLWLCVHTFEALQNTAFFCARQEHPGFVAWLWWRWMTFEGCNTCKNHGMRCLVMKIGQYIHIFNINYRV